MASMLIAALFALALPLILVVAGLMINMSLRARRAIRDSEYSRGYDSLSTPVHRHLYTAEDALSLGMSEADSSTMSLFRRLAIICLCSIACIVFFFVMLAHLLFH